MVIRTLPRIIQKGVSLFEFYKKGLLVALVSFFFSSLLLPLNRSTNLSGHTYDRNVPPLSYPGYRNS